MAFTETNEYTCLLCPEQNESNTALEHVTPVVEHLRAEHGFPDGPIKGRYQARVFMDGGKDWAQQIYVWVIDGQDVIQHTWTREPDTKTKSRMQDEPRTV